MKKVFLIGTIIFSAIFLSGCQKTNIVTCTLNKNDLENDYQMTGTYEIYTDGETVNKVITVEQIFSDNDEVLNSFEDYLKGVYNPMAENYGGYDINIKKNDDSLTSTIENDYQEVDIEKLLVDQPAMSSMVNDKNQVLLASIKASYATLGAVCE